MSPYLVTGQVTAFMNGYIKEFIGFKNIAEIKRGNDFCKIVTKDGKQFEISIKELN